MHKKKFKWTKKNITLFSLAGVLILTGLIWGIVSFNKNDKEINKPVEEPRQISMEKEDIEKSGYENLLGLDYILLRAEKIVDETKDNTLFFDIQVEKALDEEQLVSLGKESYKVLNKELNEKGTISSIHLSVFTNKEAFDKTREVEYNGEHVDGLVQTFTSTHLNENKAIVESYGSMSLETNVENLDASLDFEVVNANLSEERNLTADVVVTGGTNEQVQDMIKSLVSMLKEKNDKAVHVTLNVYDSQKNYEDGKFNYEYSTLKPSLLLKQTYLAY